MPPEKRGGGAGGEIPAPTGLLESISDAVYRCGADGAWLYVSPSIERILGVPAERLTGASVADAIHEDDRSRVEEEIARAFDAGRSYTMRYRVEGRGGRPRYVCDRGVVVERDGERVREGTIADDSQRVWSERQVATRIADVERAQRHQERLLRLVDALGGATQDLLLAGQESDVHPVIVHALAEGTGAPYAAIYIVREQNGPSASIVCDRMAEAGRGAGLEGAPCESFPLADKLVGKAIRHARQLVINGDDVPGDAEWKREAGIDAAMIYPLVFQQGAIGALMILDREPYSESLLQGVDHVARHAVVALISARRAEQIREEAAEKTALIERLSDANARLELTRSAAEQANVMKSRFLASVSHEIRTPLNGILGLAQLLSETELTFEQEDAVRALHGCADSLLELLNDVLDLSKIESGKLELESVPFSLTDTIDGLLDTLEVRAREKGIELEAIVEPEVPDLVAGDPARTRQILMNLAGNAIKFTDEGHVTIRAASRHVAGCPGVAITVEDTGPGIAKERHEAIFEPFVQADVATTRRYGGTGLGLSICRELADAMGGRLELASEPGEGSRFTFRAPFPSCEPAETDVREESAPFVGSAALVALQNPRLREATLSILSRAGVPTELLEPASGRETLDAAVERLTSEGERRAVLIHDGASGSLIAARSDLPLVELCGRPDREPGGRSAAAGVQLARPVRRSALLRALGAPLPAAALVEDEGGERDVRGIKVLLVEDHPINRKIAVRMLERAGCVVAVATNGREALEVFAQTAPDVVLMDVQMPVLDGLSATRELRALGVRGAEVPVVALTANAMKEDRDACLEAGMNGYVTKPIRIDELLDVVHEWGRAATCPA